MSALGRLKDRLYDLNALHAAIGIMDWDQQTYMPRGGAEARAAHVGILSRMSHELLAADETKTLLERAAESASSREDLALVRVAQRQYDQACKLPARLVEEKARLSAEGHEVWVKARRENRFSLFQPIMEKVVALCQEEAECLGYTEHIYDALLDQYEEGATKADCDRMFDAIRQPLVALVKEISESSSQPDDSFLTGDWDESAQRAFADELVGAIGFDMNRGRQDTAPHPFCTGWSVGDIRLTTRFLPQLNSAIFGSLHEAGHGMYEQGSPAEWDRTPLAGGVSLGIHESQSRTWENIVGRSRAFWTFFLPRLKQRFPALDGISLDQFVRGVNKAQPSLIRVEADEVTYNLHIMVRFELECDLLTNKLAVADLPEAWNAKYKQYLGITPESDSNGCLQDVHWSMGSMGYFPTYSMGNLLSCQFWAVLQKDLGDVDALMEKGSFAPILEWLQQKIYSRGRLMSPRDLVMNVTGKPIGAEDYMAHISAKYRTLYGLS